MRATAVKVANPASGKSTVAYAQLDTQFSDDEKIIPHAVDVSGLEHFVGVHIPVAPERRRVDVLIGQSDKALLAVFEERESVDPEEPNYVLTRQGPIASGGRASGNLCSSGSLSVLRVNVNSSVENDYNKLKEENVALKQSLREYELLDEIIQPSKNDKLALQLLEPNTKVVEGRYEMPVPLKSQMANNLPNNYENALKRTMSLRKTTQRNPSPKQTLVDTFMELITENQIEPVEENNICVGVNFTWYLPFFVTKTAKPRVVYDGSATFKGISLRIAFTKVGFILILVIP